MSTTEIDPQSLAGLHYERDGAGEPMVLLHGIGSELCVWEPVLEELASRYAVVAVDLPGFGSSRPLPPPLVPTPITLARMIAALLDSLGLGHAHAVGNSLGGWIALELARLGRARSVTALCPAGLWDGPVLAQDAAARTTAHTATRALRPIIPLLMQSPRLRSLALSPFVAHPERVPRSAATRMIRSYGRSTAYAVTSTAMRQTFFSGADEIDAPITVAFGERDRLIRPRRIAARDAEVVLLADCGHIPMWDDPQLVASVIERTARRAGRRLIRDHVSGESSA